MFARQLKTIIEPWKEEDETVDDADHEPPIKKRKLISDQVQNIRAKNLTRYKTAIDTILNIDKTEVFTKEVFNWCESYFLKNSPLASDQVLRVPNFVITSDSLMRPSTVDAARALFDWFRVQCKGNRNNLADMVSNLAVLTSLSPASHVAMLSKLIFRQN